MVDRIKQVMEYYEETPATFAEKLGVNRSNLTHLFSGRNQPSLEFAKKVLSAYREVRTEWLIMGVGEMIKDPTEDIVPPKKTFIQTDLFEMDEEVVDAKPEEASAPAAMDKTAVEIAAASVEQTAEDNPILKAEAPQNVDTMPKNETVEEVRLNSVVKNTIENPVQQIENKSVKVENAVETPPLELKNQNIPTRTQEIIDSPHVVNAPAMEAMMAAQQMQSVGKETLRLNSETAKQKKVEKIIFFYDDDTFKIFNA